MKDFLVFLSAWIQGLGLIHQLPAVWTFLYPAVTSMLLWPWIFVILRDIRRIYQIS
jgi:rod shape-determining protein MreD